MRVSVGAIVSSVAVCVACVVVTNRNCSSKEKVAAVLLSRSENVG
jgi:hypothetical protein